MRMRKMRSPRTSVCDEVSAVLAVPSPTTHTHSLFADELRAEPCDVCCCGMMSLMTLNVLRMCATSSGHH